MSKVCITSAISEELRGILKRAKNVVRKNVKGILVYEGELSGISVVLLKTGVGRKMAGKAIATVLDNLKIDKLISIGFCGAVSRSLSISDLVLCDSSTCLNVVDRLFKPDEKLFEKAISYFKSNELGNYVAGRCLTVDDIIYTPSKKAEMGKNHDAMIVEMENFAICEEAEKRNVPYLLVRSVSDTALDDISFLERLKGNFSKSKVALYAIRNPSIIPGLNRLRSNSALAEKRLSDFVCSFIREV